MKHHALWIAVACLAAAAGARAAASRPGRARSSGREIPIGAKVDILVVGGNEGGLAAAWKAAQLGSNVFVACGQFFFSDEVSGKARYWLDAGAAPRSEFGKALLAGRGEDPPELAPARYKRTIEDLLTEAGVAFHYTTQPAGVLVDDAGAVCGAVLANKAGVQAVVAKVVIDATPTAALARMAGAETTAWDTREVTVRRVLYGRSVSDGRRIGKFCEYSVTAAMPTGSWPQRCRAEVLLREKHNPVRDNRAHAHLMHMIEPTCILPADGEIAAEWPGADKLDLRICRPRGVEGLLVVSQSAAVSRQLAPRLTRPIALADLGERVGVEAHRSASGREMPPAPGVRTTPPGADAVGGDVREILTGHRPYRRAGLGTVGQGETGVDVWGRYDVIVVGGGTAGAPAAIAAAQGGARVLVIEMLGHLGGNMELGTPGYWKGYRHGFNQRKLRAGGLFAELRAAGADIWYNTLACGTVNEGDRVSGVVVATPLGRGAAMGRVIIDATGDADVCAAAGAEFAFLNDGDLCVQEDSFRDLGLYANVLPLDPADAHSLTMHHVLARRRAERDLWDFYTMVGMRESRLIRGDHVIDVVDQILGRTYRDLVSVSQSAYDPHGYHNSDEVYAGLMPPTKHETKPGFITYIPLRSLLPKGLEGLMVVGRCHSVTHDVQASVRMNPDMINEGYAAGRVAAAAVRAGKPLREVDLDPVQDHLAEIGNISAEDRKHRCADTPEPTDAEIAAAAEDLSEKRNLALVARGGPRSLPPLRESFAKRPTPAKAKALCLLGDTTAVEYLTGWLEEQSLPGRQPYDWDGFLSVPEVDAVMWLLGAAGDPRAVDALVTKLDRCTAEPGHFGHVRAVTTALGRIGSREAAPALHRFLGRDGVAGHVDANGDPRTLKADRFAKAFVELHAAAALVRCGDHQGLGRRILTGYLDDWRGVCARFAGYVLAEAGHLPASAGP